MNIQSLLLQACQAAGLCCCVCVQIPPGSQPAFPQAEIPPQLITTTRQTQETYPIVHTGMHQVAHRHRQASSSSSSLSPTTITSIQHTTKRGHTITAVSLLAEPAEEQQAAYDFLVKGIPPVPAFSAFLALAAALFSSLACRSGERTGGQQAWLQLQWSPTAGRVTN